MNCGILPDTVWHEHDTVIKSTPTFGAQATAFVLQVERPAITTPGFSIMDPFSTLATRQAVTDFYARYCADNRPRLFLFGINPGRFGGGVTGIPFTDPVALRQFCGIETTLTGQRELSSDFIYRMIDRYGGVEPFWADCFLSAVFPFALIRDERNINYYDDRALTRELTPYIVETMWKQISFGARRNVAIVLGTGKNADYLSRLNAEHHFFDRLIPLDHPRFIMQYRRKRLDEYLDMYVAAIRQAVAQ